MSHQKLTVIAAEKRPRKSEEQKDDELPKTKMSFLNNIISLMTKTTVICLENVISLP